MFKIMKKILEPILNTKYVFKQSSHKSVEEVFQEVWDEKTKEHIGKLLGRDNEKETISKTKFERVASHPKAKWKSAYVTDDFTKYVRSFYWRDSGGVFLYAHVLVVDTLTNGAKNEYWCRVDMRTMF